MVVFLTGFFRKNSTTKNLLSLHCSTVRAPKESDRFKQIPVLEWPNQIPNINSNENLKQDLIIDVPMLYKYISSYFAEKKISQSFCFFSSPKAEEELQMCCSQNWFVKSTDLSGVCGCNIKNRCSISHAEHFTEYSVRHVITDRVQLPCKPTNTWLPTETDRQGKESFNPSIILEKLQRSNA